MVNIVGTEKKGLPAKAWSSEVVRLLRGIFLGDYRLLPVIIATCVIFTIINPRFASVRNMQNIFLQTSVLAPVAIGQTLVILTSGIDLSVGSILGFTSAVAALNAVSGRPLWMAFAITFLIGAGLGTFNGAMITAFRIMPFIATLGMMSIARGMDELYLYGRTIYAFPWAFRFLAATKVFDIIPTTAFLTLALFIIFALVLKYTPFGRSIYAIGGNEEASIVSGINVKATKMGVYILSGLLSAWGGLILIMRMNAAEITAGSGMELNAIAAVVIGGTSMFGGKGGVWQTLLGVFLLGIILNGLDIIGVSPFLIKIITGLILLGVAGASVGRRRT